MTNPQHGEGFIDDNAKCQQVEDDAASMNTVRSEAADWVPDSQAEACMRCNAKFQYPLKRRHHCRKCGEVVCSTCSRTRQIVPEYHPIQPQRVCKACAHQEPAAEPLLEEYAEQRCGNSASIGNRSTRPTKITSLVGPVPSGLCGDFGKLHLKVVEAKGLVAADVDWRNKSTTSDPYCIVSLEGGPLYRTEHIRGTLAPRWEEELRFVLARSNSVLNLQFMDADATSKDDPIGSVSLQLGELRPGKKVRGWVPLTPTESQEDDPAGGVLLEMELTAYDGQRHLMSYLAPAPALPQPPPPFDINEVYAPGMQLKDLLWDRLIAPALFALLDLVFWKEWKWSSFVLVMWNVAAASLLPYWPALLPSSLALYTLSWRWSAKNLFDPDETYVIESVNAPGKFLNVIAGSTAAGANIQLWDNSGSDDSRWRFRHISGAWVMENAHATGKFLSVAGRSPSKGSNICLHTYPDSLCCQWRINERSRGVFTIASVKAEATYVNVSGGSTDNGTNVQVWDNPSSTHSQWRILKQSAAANSGSASETQQSISGKPKLRKLASQLPEEEQQLSGFVATMAKIAPKDIKDLCRFFAPLLRLAADACQLVHDICTWEHPGSPLAVAGLFGVAIFCALMPFWVIVALLGSSVLLGCSPVLTAALGMVSYAQWKLGTLDERKSFGMRPDYCDEWSSWDYKLKAKEALRSYESSGW